MLKYTDDFKKDVENLYPKRNDNKTYPISYTSIPLFEGLTPKEIFKLLDCTNSHIKQFNKDEPIIWEGDSSNIVGVVVSGKVQVLKADFEGDLAIITEVIPGELFGEVFACANLPAMPVSVFSAEKSTIMLLDLKKMLNTCSNSCPFHSKVIQNLLQIISQKALTLNRRIEILSKRTTRDKLICYLSMEYNRNNRTKFEIPFNRQQLADYLCVERSALSAEMSRMKKEGIIDYRKNEFWLL